MTIREFFAADGPLSIKPGYKERPGQTAMAEAVSEAITKEENLLVEAPTGTGKSFAYLVPAILSGKRVVVVTENIALQHQLIDKDLPFLQTVLPRFTFAVIKGIGNYVCKLKVDKLRKTTPELDAILAWASTSPTGDVADYDDEIHFSLKERITATSEECKKKKCEHFLDCHAFVAKDKAAKAGIIVTNYAMYLLSLRIEGTSGGKASLMPHHEVVVWDEAHAAASIAREHLGFRLSKRVFENLVKAVFEAGAEKESDQIEAAAQAWLAATADAIRLNSGRFKSVRIKREGWNPATEPLKAALEVARLQVMVLGDPDSADVLRRLNAVQCELTAANGYSKDTVCFLDGEARHPRVEGRLLHPSSFLQERLFALRTCILTSATLTVGHTFKFLRRELGVAEAKELVVQSPFDLTTQMRLYADVRAISPKQWNRRGEALAALAERIIEVAKISNGNMLVLFTSFDALSQVERHLASREVPWPVLVQERGVNRARLLESFKEGGKILLGTKSFWTGVDVPGKALSVLVIDKLPFPPQDDPIVEALGMEGNSFNRYSVPMAVIAMRQGIGRLIRSETDRGVVLIMDPRVSKDVAFYGTAFTNSVRPVRTRIWDLESARKFLVEDGHG